MATPDAYMPYFGNDFEAATKGLLPSTKWAYLSALWHYWHHTHCKGIPNEDERLRRICDADRESWQSIKADVFGPYFKLDADGLWQQGKSREIYNESVVAYQRRVEGAEKARRKKQGGVDSKVDINADIKAEINADSKVDESLQPDPKPESEPEPYSSVPPTPAREGIGLIAKAEAVEQVTMRTVIPKDFAEYVYDSWHTRQGRDGNGVLVAWVPYCTTRWSREGEEWKNGTHKGNKKPETKKSSWKETSTTEIVVPNIGG